MKNMTFKCWLLNGWYYVRFYFKSIFTTYFSNIRRNNKQKDGFDLIFEDDFVNPIDFNFWSWKEKTRDRRDQIIWKQEQIKQAGTLAVITSEANNVPDEPLAKTGSLFTWNSLNLKHGFFEGRFKVSPSGIKYWNAFWLCSSDSWPPEIDIFELMGIDSSFFTMTMHWRDVLTNKDKIQEVYDEIYKVFGYVAKDFDDTILFLQQPEWSVQKQEFIDKLLSLSLNKCRGRRLRFYEKDFLSNQFHTYACEWSEDKVIWYIDNIKVFVLDKHIPERKMHIILGNNYTYKDKPNLADFPMHMYCDYVRVYQQKTK